MAIQQVGNAVTAVALNLPGKAAPQGVDAGQATQASAAGALPQESAPSSLEQVQQAMEQVAKKVQANASTLEFSIDEDTGSTIVKIVDSATQEVIRQIPSQEIIDIARAIDKVQGLLVQQKA